MSPDIVANSDVLNFLLKIAATGTSGICVLAIAWTGYLMQRVPDTAPRAKHINLRLFMVMCFFIAVLSAATTFGAGYWDYKGKEALKAENTRLATATTNAVQASMQYSNQWASAAFEILQKNKSEAALSKRADELSNKLAVATAERDDAQNQLTTVKSTSIDPEALRELQATVKTLQSKNEALQHKLETQNTFKSQTDYHQPAVEKTSAFQQPDK